MIINTCFLLKVTGEYDDDGDDDDYDIHNNNNEKIDREYIKFMTL